MRKYDFGKPLSYLTREDIETLNLDECKEVLEIVSQLDLSTKAKVEHEKSLGGATSYLNARSFYYAKVKRHLKARIKSLQAEALELYKSEKRRSLNQDNHNLRREIAQLKKIANRVEHLEKIERIRAPKFDQLKATNHDLTVENARLKKENKLLKLELEK